MIGYEKSDAAYSVLIDYLGRLTCAFPLPLKIGGTCGPIELDLDENTASWVKACGLFGQDALSGLSFRESIANFCDQAEAMIRTNSV